MDLPIDHKEMLTAITKELNGEINHYTTLNSTGRQSQKIVIEYDIKQKEDDT